MEHEQEHANNMNTGVTVGLLVSTVLLRLLSQPKARVVLASAGAAVAGAAQALAPAWPMGVVVGTFAVIHIQQRNSARQEARQNANQECLECSNMLALTWEEQSTGEEHFNGVISHPLMLQWNGDEQQPASEEEPVAAEPAAAVTEDRPVTPGAPPAAAPADLAAPTLPAATPEHARRMQILAEELKQRFNAALGHYQADIQQVLITRPEGTAESLCRHLMALAIPGMALMGERLDGNLESGGEVMELAIGVLVEALKQRLDDWRFQQEAAFRMGDRRENECARVARVLHQEIEHVMRQLPNLEEDRRRRSTSSI